MALPVALQPPALALLGGSSPRVLAHYRKSPRSHTKVDNAFSRTPAVGETAPASATAAVAAALVAAAIATTVRPAKTHAIRAVATATPRKATARRATDFRDSFAKSLFEDSSGRPRLLGAAKFLLRSLLRILVSAEVSSLQVEADSNMAVVLGRFRDFRVEIAQIRRGLRMRQVVVDSKVLDLSYKLTLLALLPFLIIWRPSLLPPLVLVLLVLPGKRKTAAPLNGDKQQISFSAHLSADDLQKSLIWRFFLTTALRDIMNYSVAGLVALPREVSGELSSATSFELEEVDVAEQHIVMKAVAKLPDNALFKYKLRTSASLGEVRPGEQCIVWDDPCIRVKPGWPLPNFWAPIGGFAGRRLVGVHLTQLNFPVTGGVDLAGRFCGNYDYGGPGEEPKTRDFLRLNP